MNSFSLLRTPRIVFGCGQVRELAAIVKAKSKHMVLVTGHSWLKQSGLFDDIVRQCSAASIHVEPVVITGEPTTDSVDQAARLCRDLNVSSVVAIGGGSVLDAGKAIAAMACHEGPVERYLEGPNALPATGAKIPLVAIPTTAGTGSEATSNAVLRIPSQNNIKKSLRHPDFVADVAIIDPQLMVRCPPAITAACGMDAITQLIESYVSVKAIAVTDALAVSGIQAAMGAIHEAVVNGENVAARSAMAYGALMSGITLANAGLGVVHGIAGSLGGFFSIPHGVVCARLLGPAIKITLELLRNVSAQHPSLARYGEIGRIAAHDQMLSIEDGCDKLVDIIMEWQHHFPLPQLSDFGVGPENIDAVVAASASRFNPIEFDAPELRRLVLESL